MRALYQVTPSVEQNWCSTVGSAILRSAILQRHPWGTSSHPRESRCTLIDRTRRNVPVYRATRPIKILRIGLSASIVTSAKWQSRNANAADSFGCTTWWNMNIWLQPGDGSAGPSVRKSPHL